MITVVADRSRPVPVRDKFGDPVLSDAVERVIARLPAALRDDLEEIVLLRRVVVRGELSRIEIGGRVRVVVIVEPLADRVGAGARGLTAAVLEQVLIQIGRYALLRSGDGLFPSDAPEVERVASELLGRVKEGR